VEMELEALSKHPEARCVYSNVRIIDGDGRLMKVRDEETQPSGDIFVYVARRKFGLLRSMVIDYTLLQELGFLDERFPKYDGFDLTVRLAKQCQFAYVSEPLVEYRVHSDSDSKGLKAKEHLHDLQGIYKKMLPLLTDLPIVERKEISKIWSRTLFKWRARHAIESGQKLRSLLMTLWAIVKGHAKRRDLREIICLIRNYSKRSKYKKKSSSLSSS